MQLLDQPASCLMFLQATGCQHSSWLRLLPTPHLLLLVLLALPAVTSAASVQHKLQDVWAAGSSRITTATTSCCCHMLNGSHLPLMFRCCAVCCLLITPAASQEVWAAGSSQQPEQRADAAGCSHAVLDSPGASTYADMHALRQYHASLASQCERLCVLPGQDEGRHSMLY